MAFISSVHLHQMIIILNASAYCLFLMQEAQLSDKCHLYLICPKEVDCLQAVDDFRMPELQAHQANVVNAWQQSLGLMFPEIKVCRLLNKAPFPHVAAKRGPTFLLI